MASDSKKLFGCPSCGFRVAGTEDSCPRCGAKFEEKSQFECPFCGEPADPSSKKCPSCRIAFEDFVSKAEKGATDESIDSLLTEIIERESRQVKEEAKKLSCPKCSWMVHRTEERCPKCGVVFSEAVAYQCPVCAALVPFDAETCDDCGAVFVTVEDAAPKREEVPEKPPVEQESAASEAELTKEKAKVELEPATEKIETLVSGGPEEEASASEEPLETKPKTITKPKMIKKPKAPSAPAAPKKRVRRRKLKPKPKS